MKWNYIATAAAALLLIGTGIYWFNNHSQSPEYKNTPIDEKYIEIIDGEEIILDTPLTKSFSNAESNKKSQEKKKTKKTNSTSSSSLVKNTLVSKTIKPFVIAIYYLDTIKKNGFENCSPAKNAAENTSETDQYIGKEFELTRIEKSINQTFVFVDVENVPEKTCARFLQFKNITTAISEPLHIFIK